MELGIYNVEQYHSLLSAGPKSADFEAAVYALILKLTGRSVDEFRRIGVATLPCYDHIILDGWERRTITIV
jgi:hypothetical protein